jgi:hypothetical protein
MELKSAAEYLEQFHITMNFDKPIVEPKYPFMSFEDKRNMKKIGKIVKEIRPNYPEYQNAKLYKEDNVSTWVHVCEASLESGISPVRYVSQSLPMKDIENRIEDTVDIEYIEDIEEEFSGTMC